MDPSPETIPSPPAAATIEIRNRFTRAVIHASQAADMRTAVIEAVASRTNLGSADLRYADLRYADLRCADLGCTDLRYADLRYADLGCADLGCADLRYADLRYADLAGVKVNWTSHVLLGEILRQAAGNSVGKRKIAGLVLVSTDWCWPEFMKLRGRKGFEWAVETLAPFVTDGDGAPLIVREAFEAIQAKKASETASV